MDFLNNKNKLLLTPLNSFRGASHKKHAYLLVKHDSLYLLKNHLKYRQKGFYLAGRRVELGPDFSKELAPEVILKGGLNGMNLGLVLSCLKKDSAFWHRSIPVYNPFLRQLLKMEGVDDLKGCNFSVDRESLFQINGFDEDYEGYAREDTDLEIRLQYLGLKIKSLKGLCIQYHIWHEHFPESEKNVRKLKDLRVNKDPKCKNGLIKAL